MFEFYVWETVDIPIGLERRDDTPALEGYKDVIVSLEQRGFLMEYNADSPDLRIDELTDYLYLYLGQEQTWPNCFSTLKQARARFVC